MLCIHNSDLIPKNISAMRKESMKTTRVAPYETPESTVFRVTTETNILSGSIEEPGEEPL